MNKKKEEAKEYAKRVYLHEERMRLQCEKHFEAGWEAAMDYLRSLSVSKAIEEIVQKSENK